MSHRRASTRTVLGASVTAAALLLAGCGSDPSPRYGSHVREQLRADTAHVRTAADQHDVPAAQAALQQLTRDVAHAQAANHLPRRRARRILDAADAVTADLAALPTPTPTPSKRPPSRSPKPEHKPKNKPKPKHGTKHGPGHGHKPRHHKGH